MDKAFLTKKNYEMWQGRHQFWFKGSAISGPSPYKLLITFILIQITNIFSLSFTWTVISQLITCLDLLD